MPTPLPLILELVGPAGAGKSTLMSALAGQGANITGVRIEIRKHWPLVCTAAAFAARSEARPGLRRSLGPGLRLYEGTLRRQLGSVPRVVLLDEGPVFRLVRLHLAQRPKERSKVCLKDFLQAALRRWAGTVDGLVWLDAPDPVLAERIRSRAKAHRVKDSSGGEITRFLADYRAAYSRVAEELFRAPNARVLRIESGVETPEDLALKALAYIDQEWPEWQAPSAL